VWARLSAMSLVPRAGGHLVTASEDPLPGIDLVEVCEAEDVASRFSRLRLERHIERA
jgi:hypothetical protein